MNVSQFVKFSTTRYLLLVSFLLLQITNTWAWRLAKDLELYLKEEAQLEGYDFLPYTQKWYGVCKKGTEGREPLFTVDDMGKVDRKSDQLKIVLLQHQVEYGGPTLPVILCAERDGNDYYFGRGPMSNTISVYIQLAGSNELNCVGIIEEVSFENV